MRKMKDSGHEYIGLIPINWSIKRIKDIYSFDTGFTPSTEIQSNYNDENGYEWATISDINGGLINKPTKSLISRSFISSSHKKQCPVGSLLYSFKLSVGQTAIVDRPVFTNEALACFYNTNDVNLRFLKYASCLIEHNANINIYGARILNQDLIKNAPIVCPPIDEQKRIAAYLDGQCKKIDEIMADIQSQIDTLDDYKKSVIFEAVTKGLNKKVKYKKTSVSWAKEIPEHWNVMPNKYIMKKVKIICSIHKDEPILSLSMNGVIVRDLEAGGKMPTSFDGYQYIYPGNILMCLFDYDVTPRCIGYINDYGVTSPAYSQFEMKSGNNAKYYYYYYLMIDNTKELLHLAKNLRHSFTEDELGKINQIVPPMEEQKAIADYLGKKCAEIDSVIAAKKLQLSILENYKKSLIYEYVTGKKEVPENE